MTDALNETRLEGDVLERSGDKTNESVRMNNIVSNLIFSVIIYLYIYFVCHAVLSSDHQIWLILNNLVAVQIIYMCVSVYASSSLHVQ